MPTTEPSVTATPPSRPVRADAARNRERLLAAADDAFAERGTEASLEDVARRAGVGIGTLYRHFPTRDDLVAALIEGEVEDLVALAGDLLTGPDPRAALRTWLAALIAHVTRYRGLASSLVDARCGEGRLTESCHRQEAAAAALVERAAAAGHLRDEVAVADVLALVSALAWLAEGGREADPEHLLDLVLDGLSARM
jgi:AcrR family transcriptional regulator